MRMKTLSIGLVALAFVSVLTASVATADTFGGNIFLDPVGNTLTTGCGGLCPGPYASIAITTDGSATAHVTFTGLTNGTFRYLIIGPNDVGLVLSTTLVTVGNFSFTQLAGFSSPLPFTATIAAGQHIDGTGDYNLVIDGGNGYVNAVTSLSFDIVRNGGTGNWGAAASVINNTTNHGLWINSITGLPTESNSWATAHIAVCGNASSCSPATAALATAWAGGAVTTDITQVPEPGTLALLGSGLLMLGTLARRFKK